MLFTYFMNSLFTSFCCSMLMSMTLASRSGYTTVNLADDSYSLLSLSSLSPIPPLIHPLILPPLHLPIPPLVFSPIHSPILQNISSSISLAYHFLYFSISHHHQPPHPPHPNPTTSQSSSTMWGSINGHNILTQSSI